MSSKKPGWTINQNVRDPVCGLWFTDKYVFLEVSRLSMSSLVYSIVGAPYAPNPLASAAKRVIRICVPDEWYRRSKSRNVSTASFEPSESTIRRLAALQESDEDDEDEGTAKLSTASDSRPSSTVTADWRGSLSQNRLSSLFDGWLGPASPTSPNRNITFITADNRKSVSEPMLVEHSIGRHRANSNVTDEPVEGVDEVDFENMLVSLCLSGGV